ncbi:MAG: alpha/beta fold hydrolase [Promethearchaeia archaeon]
MILKELKHLLKHLRTLQFKKTHKSLLFLILLTIFSSFFAFLIQNDFGKVKVQVVKIVDADGNSLSARLYRPITATEDSPQSGVLLLHGFNNDKDTEGPAALELARRGFVCLALSELGHGDSVRGQGLDSSILLDGGEVTLGADSAYKYLKSLSFVNKSEIGLVGHSMGGWVAINLAKKYSNHRAVVIQAGGPLNLTEKGNLNNYLQIWTHYEELFSTDDRNAYIQEGLEMIKYNTGKKGEFDKTYGDFDNGTAQRYALCETTHPGGTWNSKSISETTKWMINALNNGELDLELPDPEKQIYQWKEVCMLIASIAAILSLLPLSGWLLKTDYFQELNKKISSRNPAETSQWWKTASLNAFIGGLSFLVIPMVGMIIGAPLPLFNLVTGNGTVLWFLFNAIIGWIVFKKWFRDANEEQNLSYYDLGILDKKKDKHIGFTNLKKTLLLAAILFVYLYALTSFIQVIFQTELRYQWALLKRFSAMRFGQFLLYLLPISIFFFINGGVLLYGQLRQKKYENAQKTLIVWWLKSCFAMEMGLVLIMLVQYLPMILFGAAPLFGWLPTAGLFLIFLMQFVPFFALMFFLTTYFFLKTGRIYLGSIIATILTTWVISVSSAVLF